MLDALLPDCCVRIPVSVIVRQLAHGATMEEVLADFNVSRDPHLRNLKRFQGVEIVDVRTFVERVKREK